MQDHTTTDEKHPALTLPAGAPQVRLTAGLGSAGQKTWNLRRSVTLIGNRRPAHIVLHDKDIAKTHCVIVHTGSDVLLKDLHTGVGTFVNRERVDLALLKDGDIISVGDTHMQVAIQVPDDPADDSGCGVEYVDPLRFPLPVTVRLLRTDKVWVVDQAVAMIGRQEEAAIRLDHDEVSHRHAVLFRFRGRPAVFDLASREGMWVNGKRVPVIALENQDCITIGPFGLSIHMLEKPSLDGVAAAPQAKPGAAPNAAAEANSKAEGPPPNTPPAGGDTPADPQAGKGRLSAIEAELSALQTNISQAWHQLNNWPATTAPGPEQTIVNTQQAELAARSAELDERDAALRGQLHDVTRLQEQLADREREFDSKVAVFQREQDELAAAQKTYAEQQAEVQKLQGELQKRENVLTQRWTRIRTAACPHCGKPMNLSQLGNS